MAKPDDKDVPNSQKGFSRLIAEAALHTPNMVIAGGAAVAAAALHSIPVAALGGATYLAMVAWDMVSPEFWKKKTGERKASTALPARSELSNVELQELLDQVNRAQANLAKTWNETPAGVQSHLTAAIVLAGELDGRAATLFRRADDIHRTLRGINRDAVDKEIKKLTLQERDAADAAAREQYGQARAAREEQRRGIDDIAGVAERAQANLSRIVAVLEGLAVKIALLRANDAATMDAVSGDIGRELDEVNIELRAFEDTLASIRDIQGMQTDGSAGGSGTKR